MQGSTHMVGGAALVAAATIGMQFGLAPAEEFMMIGLGAIGGLIPDIDHPNSKISHKLKPVSAFVSLVFSHRGFFHTPIFYTLLWLIWLLRCPLPEYALWGHSLFLGIFSHLFLDALNPGGIPAFFPFSTKRYHIAKIRTGSVAETPIRLGLVAATFCLVVMYLL